MKSIQVNSLPLNLVISDIAKFFNSTVKNSCGEFWVNIPKQWGEGTIRGINFDGGLGIIQYDCKFHEDLEIQFIVNEVHPLKFVYCIEGNLKHSFEDEDQWHELNQFQCNIVGSQDHHGHIIQFLADTKTQINSLEISREDFQSKMDCEMESLNPTLKKLFLDEYAKTKFYYEGYYSLQIADIFRQIKNSEHEDFVNKLFMEGKAYQILTQQILQYQDDMQEVGERSVLRRSEFELVEKAAKLIEKNIADLDNIDELAKKVGLNVNKLQDGFKYSYQNTVNGYIQKIRIEMARDLLMNSEHNISEIVQQVGLSSKSYFSKIFKEKFNMSPSDFRKKFRNFNRKT